MDRQLDSGSHYKAIIPLIRTNPGTVHLWYYVNSRGVGCRKIAQFICNKAIIDDLALPSLIRS